MAATFTFIAKKSVPSDGTNNITFTSIPAAYTDLMLYVSTRDTFTGSGRGNWSFTVNGIGSGYAWQQLYGIPTIVVGSNLSAAGSNNAGGYQSSASTTANTFGSGEVYFPAYRSGINKSFSALGVSEDNAAATGLSFASGYLGETNPITSITITEVNATGFVSGSTFYLYGISNA